MGYFIIFIITLVLAPIIFTLLFVGGSLIALFRSRKIYKQKEIDISKLQKGDIILTGTNKAKESWYIKISNILTNGIDSKFWTHAALHIGEGKLIEAQPTGIVYNSISDYLSKRGLVKVFRHKYIHSKNELLDELIDFCEQEKEEGCKYGWIGLVFYVVGSFVPVSANFIFDNEKVDRWCNFDKAYFCSELVAAAYNKIGYKLSPFDNWRIKPSDFIKNPFLEEVI